jgi:hypothetical protein
MKKVLFVLLILLFAGTVFATSVHLKGGKNAEPTLFDNGFTLEAFGELSGLGNGDVLITMNATADVYATCINPGSGEHRPPGQNPADINVTGAIGIPEDEVKNGWTPFGVETVNPFPDGAEIVGAPDCPNVLWTERVEDIAFKTATIIVEQPVGTTVLTVVCTIDPPTVDGPVDKKDVECTQVK